jgi:hypothetical protein
VEITSLIERIFGRMAWGRLVHGRGEIVPKKRGNISERTTSEFEARTDGWIDKCVVGR